MKISALIGPAHHGDDQVGVAPYLLVAHRRLEQMLVVFDPLGKIDGFEHGRTP